MVWCGVVWCGGVGCGVFLMFLPLCDVFCDQYACIIQHIMCQLTDCFIMPPPPHSQGNPIAFDSHLCFWGVGEGGNLDLAWKGLNWHLNSMLVFRSRNWNKPIFKSSNAWKVTWEGDIEVLY